MSHETNHQATRETGSQLPPENPPESPTKLPKRSWFKVIKGAAKEFSDDNLSDTAAALTYYAIQSIFPAALVLVSLLGFLKADTVQQLIDNLGEVIPGSAKGTIEKTIQTLTASSRSSAGLAFILGLVLAIWSASGYVAAFMRASNVVYDIPEGRPI